MGSIESMGKDPFATKVEVFEFDDLLETARLPLPAHDRAQPCIHRLLMYDRRVRDEERNR